MFVLWVRGLRGPEFIRVSNKQLSEHDRKLKLCDPEPIMPKEEKMPLDDLKKLYPAPEVREER